jgi:hypothetical protein
MWYEDQSFPEYYHEGLRRIGEWQAAEIKRREQLAIAIANENIRRQHEAQAKREKAEHAAREVERKRAEESWQRYELTVKGWKERERKRIAAHTALAGEFSAAGNRERWVAIERAKGRSLRDIADQLGLGPERIRQMHHKHLLKARLSMHRFRVSRGNIGRPIDMGGPRDVWLEYGPGTDPRQP